MRDRLTYANVMATIAVFIALGGASYAATQLPKNSIGTKQLKKNAVTSAKVKDRSLKAVDFGADQLPVGPAGATGDTGLQGAVGPTQGFAIPVLAGAIPSKTPEEVLFSESLTLTSGGRLFVFGRGVPFLKCNGSASAFVGLYVDGSPVTASGVTIPTATNQEISLWGLSGPVGPGPHELTMQSDCPSGPSEGTSISGDGALGAILLGS